MGCIQGSQRSKSIDNEKKAWQLLADSKQQEALHIYESTPLENNEDADRISDLMIKTFQQMSKNHSQIQQLLEQRFNKSLCEKDRTRIAFLLAKILTKLSLFDKAALWYAKLTQINPKHQQSYLLLADILQKMQRYQEIVPLLEIGHKNLPQDREIIKKICSFCEQVNQHGKSAQFYEKLIVLEPENHQNYYQYVKNDLQSNNYHIVKSQNYLFQGSKLQGKLGSQQGKQSYQFYYLYGYFFYRLRRYELAKQMANSSIDQNNLFKPSYYLLQRIFRAVEMIKVEKSVILEVLNLYPHSKKTQSLLANFYWRQEQYDSAAKIVEQILANKDDTQILDTAVVAKAYNYSGQPKKAEEYLFALLKRCKVQSQAHAIYSEIVHMHSFNYNWLMAYHFACIRDRHTERKLYKKIKVAQFCLELNKDDELLLLIDQIQRKIRVLSRGSIIQFMDILQQAQRYDECLQIYDTHFIASKKTLKPLRQVVLNIVMANCYYQLGRIDDLMEIITELQSLAKFAEGWDICSIMSYMKICSKLWNYQRLKHLYEIFVMKVKKRQINGYKWGEVRYQETLTKYRDILLEEERRVSAATPQ